MQSLSAEILTGCWYVALTGAELKRGQMRVLRLADVPIVIARGSSGAVFAMRDTCPHRGVPLHYGRVVGDQVVCAYHGWRFDAGGECVEIPSLAAGQALPTPAIRCGSFRTLERYGLIWVYWPQRNESAIHGRMSEPPVLPSVAHDSAPLYCTTVEFPSSIDHSVLALMDLTHAPFVHNVWWFKRNPRQLRPKQKRFGPSPFGFCMQRHPVPAQNFFYHWLLGQQVHTQIQYQLPGFRIESVDSAHHWAVAFTAHTPVNADSTVVRQCLWSSSPRLAIVAPLMQWATRFFLNQDRHFVQLQREGLQSRPKLTLIEDADTQARWWLSLKQHWIGAQATGEPFANPVVEQELKWRS